MSDLNPIVRWPNPILKQACEDVAVNDPQLQTLIGDLKATLTKHGAGAAGLAANQLGVSKRVLVLRVSPDIEIFVNPRIVKRLGDKKDVREGCLSLPGWVQPVPRFETVQVQHDLVMTDELGNRSFETKTIEYDGFRAQVLQHEIDHLYGKFFLDYRKGSVDQVRAAMRKGLIK